MKNTFKHKFNLASVTEFGNDGGAEMVLVALQNDQEDLSKAVGTIKVTIANADDKLELGEYIVEITKVQS